MAKRSLRPYRYTASKISQILWTFVLFVFVYGAFVGAGKLPQPNFIKNNPLWGRFSELIHLDFGKESVENEDKIKTNDSKESKAVLAETDSDGGTSWSSESIKKYKKMDDMLKNPEYNKASTATGEYKKVQTLPNQETVTTIQAVCTKGVTKYYVMEAEYVDAGLVLPASYVGYKKTYAVFKDPEGHDAALYQEPYKNQLSAKDLKKSVTNGTMHQDDLAYTSESTPNKPNTGGIQKRMVQSSMMTSRAPGEKGFGSISDGLYKELSNSGIVKEFEIPLKFNVANSQAVNVMRSCNVRRADLILTAPDQAASSQYSNAFNMALAGALTDGTTKAKVRTPGQESMPHSYMNDKDAEVRIQKYLLTTIGFDITYQTDIPDDAGVFYKAKVKLGNILDQALGRINNKERPLPLVASKKGRNYTIVPVKCSCVGTATHFDWNKLKVVPTYDENGRPMGTHYSCSVDFGYASLGNVDLPTSSKTGVAFNRGYDAIADASFSVPGDILKGVNLTVEELAYINCRMSEDDAKYLFESDKFRSKVRYVKIKDKKVDALKLYRQLKCNKYNKEALISSWMSNALFYVQKVPFKLKPLSQRSNCTAANGSVVNSLEGATVSAEVLGFLDPRSSVYTFLDRVVNVPINTTDKSGNTKKKKVPITLSSTARLSCLIAGTKKYYNWKPVVYILEYDKNAGAYRLKLEDIGTVLGFADPKIKLEKCRMIIPGLY